MSGRRGDLPDDPDLPGNNGSGGARRPLHLTPTALGLVAAGGMAGTAARYTVSLLVPSQDGWPLATLTVNLLGAFALGLLLEALARRGSEDEPGGAHRRRLRLVLGTGFCGAFTTYSALAVDLDLLLRGGQTGTAVAYAASTVAVGFLLCALGIWLGARRHGSAATT